MSLNKVFSPRGVAVVGASDNAKKFGGLTLENLLCGGYAGHIVPINPSRAQVMGVQAFARVSDAGVPIDVAVVALPKTHVPDVIRDCAKVGVSYLLVMSGGYGETGAQGLADERAMVELAREHGIRVIGPNLLGLASTPTKLQLNASLAMREVPPTEGGISLVSQSGATMGVLYNRGAREGIAFRHLIALGNQSDLEIAEIMEYYAEDEGTRVIISSLESLKDPARYLAAARRCHKAGKPVIVVKTGRTAEGAKVAATHTGSMASAYNAFAAKCTEAGITLVEDEFTMARLAALYDKYGEPPREGGVAFLSPSGGMIAHATDRVAELGMRLATFKPETVAKLETLYVPGLTDNPLDFANMKDNSFVDVGDGGAGFVADDPDVAAIVGIFGTAHNLDEMVTGMAGPVGRKKPLLFAVLPGQNGDKARKASAALGLLAVDSIDDSLKSVRAWLTPRPTLRQPAPRPATAGPLVLRGAAAGTVLGEHESKEILADYGIRVTHDRKALSEDEAAAEARAIGFPVVLKGFGRTLIHKSDVGAVKLNLIDEQAVRAAWHEIAASVGAALEGCVVTEMVKGEAELILGIVHDSQFGPMVLFGAGGIFAEIMDDVAVLPAPAHPDVIRAKLKGLKIAAILKGARGRPACDVDALVETIFRLSLLAGDAGARVQELDINPLIVGVDGRGAIAVDARLGVG